MDEFEGFSEEEEELSPEDRALMNQGIADVQAALGVEASKVTTAQIEESLWHYYYDIDKTVTYLTTKFINPPPKATKPAPQQQQPNGKSVAFTNDFAPAGLSLELDAHPNWARKCLDLTGAAISAPRVQPSFSHFFRDMPWGNIPKHRETTFIPPPAAPGGLLGGSGAPPKMSKLQALAAARKKKAEEKNAGNDKVEEARMGVKELSVKEPLAEKENLRTAGPFSKRLKTSEPAAQDRIAPAFATQSTQPEPAQPIVVAKAPEDELPLAKAQPSAFAQSLFGSSSNARKSKAPKDELPDHQAQQSSPPKIDFSFCVGKAPKPTATAIELGPAFELTKRKRDDSDEFETTVVLYPNLPQFVRDKFAQPSPDDIVLAAQAQAKGKGSLVVKSTR